MGDLFQIVEEVQEILMIAMLVAGGIECFFGYKLFRIMTAIIGFIIGGIIGAFIGAIMGGGIGAVICFLVLGILGAMLAYQLYKLGVFIVCFGSGAMVGLMLALLMEDADAIKPLMAVVGLIVGIVGVILTKPVIIISTSVGGGMAMGAVLGQLFNEMPVGLVLGIIFAVIGMLIQFYLNKKRPDNETPSAPKVRQPRSPFTLERVKTLAKEDFTSRQALYGAVLYGLLGFTGFGFTVIGLVAVVVLITFGVCVGGCANQSGEEYFIVDKEIFKTRKVIIGAVIGIVYGLLCIFWLLPDWVKTLQKIWVFICGVIVCTIIGYLLEIISRYKIAHTDAVPTTLNKSKPATTTPTARVSIPAIHQKDLAKNASLLWTEGLPIVITQANIIPRAEDPNLVSLSLEFQNLGEQAVIAVYFRVKCFNLLKQELEPVDKLTVQDFVLEPGKSWTSVYPYALPDSDTRRVELTVKNIVLQDGSIWSNEADAPLTPVLGLIPLGLSDELTSELELLGRERLERHGIKKLWPYQPQQTDHYWVCACGQMNLGKICLNCGIDQATVFELTNAEYLSHKLETRITEQQQREAERAEERARREAELRQKVSEQTQSAKENAAKLMDKSKKAVIQGKNVVGEKGKAAQAKTAAWRKAFTLKAAVLWKEKIMPNKKRIIAGTVAAVAVFVAIPVSIHFYQAQKAEEARILQEQRIAEERRIAEEKRIEEERIQAEQEAEARRQAQQLQQFQEECDQIIAEQQIQAGNLPGVCYADYIDFENDSSPELFLLALEQIPDYEGMDAGLRFAMTVYGFNEGHADLLGEERINGGIYDSVKLCERQDSLYIHVWRYAGKMTDGYDDYYGIENGQLTLVDSIWSSCLEQSVDGSERWEYTYFDESISEDEYTSIRSSYIDWPDEIVSLDYTTPTINDRGILPEPSSDTVRRAAMLDALNNTSEAKFAALIDTNQDGIEELVVLRGTPSADYGDRYYFRIFTWNGTELQTIDLDKTSDPETTDYLQIGFYNYSIQSENSTGDIYFVYSGEIAGGWGGTLFVNSTDDRFYSEPFVGDGDPESGFDETAYEAELAAYQKDLNQYSLIEDCGSLWDNEKIGTVEDVRQQLMGQ